MATSSSSPSRHCELHKVNFETFGGGCAIDPETQADLQHKSWKSHLFCRGSLLSQIQSTIPSGRAVLSLMLHCGAIGAALGDTRGASAAALGPDAVRHGSVGEVSPRDRRQSRTVVREGLTSIVDTLVQ